MEPEVEDSFHHVFSVIEFFATSSTGFITKADLRVEAPSLSILLRSFMDKKMYKTHFIDKLNRKILVMWDFFFDSIRRHPHLFTLNYKRRIEYRFHDSNYPSIYISNLTQASKWYGLIMVEAYTTLNVEKFVPHFESTIFADINYSNDKFHLIMQL